MPDYSNGKIYKIYSTKNPNMIYIGSTTQTLKQRLSQHITEDCCEIIFDKYGVETCVIELLQDYPCNTKQELERLECYWIKADRDYTIINYLYNNNRCVNNPHNTNMVQNPITFENHIKIEKYREKVRKEQEERIERIKKEQAERIPFRKLRVALHTTKTGKVYFIPYFGIDAPIIATRVFFNTGRPQLTQIY